MSTEFIENLSLPSMFSPIQSSNTLPTVLISIDEPENIIHAPEISIEKEWVQITYYDFWINKPNPLSGVM